MIKYLTFVFRSEDNNSPSIGQSLELSTHGLYYCSSQDVGSMSRELHDVLGNFVQKQSSIKMLFGFGDSLDSYDIRMKDGKLLFKLKRYGHIRLLNVLVRLEQNVMGAFVVSALLLL